MANKNPILQAKSRAILAEYQDVFDQAKKDIAAELQSERINENDAFGYAKKMIRREGIMEGLLLLEQKINTYATE